MNKPPGIIQNIKETSYITKELVKNSNEAVKNISETSILTKKLIKDTNDNIKNITQNFAETTIIANELIKDTNNNIQDMTQHISGTTDFAKNIIEDITTFMKYKTTFNIVKDVISMLQTKYNKTISDVKNIDGFDSLHNSLAVMTGCYKKCNVNIFLLNIMKNIIFNELSENIKLQIKNTIYELIESEIINSNFLSHFTNIYFFSVPVLWISR